MTRKLKTFWLNIGMIDRDMAVGARIQILQALEGENVEVRANFNYIQTPAHIHGLSKVWLLPLRRKGILGSILLFAEQQLTLIKNLDVDVVVLRPFNLHQTLLLWFLLRKILRRRFPKFILDVRSLAVDPPPGRWRTKQYQQRFDTSLRIAFKYFDGLTIITEKMKRDFLTDANNLKNKMCVWTSGVDPDLFDPDKIADLRGELKLNDRFVIMYHGIFSPNRGLQQVIEAIDLVQKGHPEVILFLLGSGPAQPEFEDLIQRLRLQEHIIIHPPVSHEEVPSYVKSAQVGILPFPDLDWWNTSSPIKLMEYLAIGKPVIVTDITAHRAVLGQSKCGFFVSDHQPINIAKGIETAIKNSSKLSVLGEMARKTAIERFTWKKQAEKIKAFLHDLVKEK